MRVFYIGGAWWCIDSHGRELFTSDKQTVISWSNLLTTRKIHDIGDWNKQPHVVKKLFAKQTGYIAPLLPDYKLINPPSV